MHELIATYNDPIAGVLSGFDRLVFRGTLRRIAYPFGLQGYLWANQVLRKDFGAHAPKTSEIVKTAALQAITAAGRPVRYLASSRQDKEKVAREIAAQDQIQQGPVCALTCVEPCWGYDIHRHRQTRQLVRPGAAVAEMSVCLSILAGRATRMEERAPTDLVPILRADLPQRAGMAGAADDSGRDRVSKTGQLFRVGSGLETCPATAGGTTA